MTEKEMELQEENFFRGSCHCGWSAEGKFIRRLCTANVIKSQYGDKNGACSYETCPIMLEVVSIGKTIED